MAHSLWGYVSDLSGPGHSRLGWKRTSPNLKLGNQKLAYQTIFWIYLRPIEENFRYYFSRVGSASSCLIIFRVFRHNFIASSVLAPILLKDSLQYDSYNNCVVLCRITYTPSFITHYVWFIVYKNLACCIVNRKNSSFSRSFSFSRRSNSNWSLP